MRLAVSNIAWDRGEDTAVLATLKQRGVAGIEIAPTRLWPDWQGATEVAARALRFRLAAQGFAVPALQAILFGKTKLALFGDAAITAEFIDHIRHVADLAAELGAHAMVFGAPKARRRGKLDMATALKRAVETFIQIGSHCVQRGVALCIEPNPPSYDCDFVINSAEGLELVKQVNSPGVRLHLDSAAMKLAGEDPGAAIAAAKPWLAHFHVSEPNLAPIVPATIDHAANADHLEKAGYKDWVSIEMRRTGRPVESVVAAVEHVQRCYGDRLTKQASVAGYGAVVQ
ncbi:MAG: sugar phosphate isomerase/epimerase family protein [Dongiaceae bacterium]